MRSRRVAVRCLAVLAATTVIALPGPVAAQAPRMTVLGTDPASDAAPGGDLTEFAVAREGDALHMRFTFANSIPWTGTYGPPAGIEWIFKVKDRTFLAEGYQQGSGFRFTLFQKNGDAWTQLEDMEGSFDTIAGVMDIFVPLKSIAAKPGTRIGGAGENDVDVHIHAGVQTIYPDALTTTKDFVIPR